MNISVQGSRTSSADWESVRNLPAEQLPPLSPEQREVARKLGISQDDYARSFLAGERTMEKMVSKTERLARFLAERLRRSAREMEIEAVILNTWDGKFEVSVRAGDRVVPIRIAEEVVDDYFDSGSPEMEQRIERVLSLAIHAQVA